MENLPKSSLVQPNLLGSPFRTQLTNNSQFENAATDHRDVLSANKENLPFLRQTENATLIGLNCDQLEKEVELRNMERDEMLHNIQKLTERNNAAKDALRREESVKQHQITVMKKTHETQTEIKNALIKNLEDIIDEQEGRIFNLEGHIAGLKVSSPAANKRPLNGVRNLHKLIDELTVKNDHLTEQSVEQQKTIENLHISHKINDFTISDSPAGGCKKTPCHTVECVEVSQKNDNLVKELKQLKIEHENLEGAYKRLQLNYDRLDVEFSEKLLLAERQEFKLISQHSEIVEKFKLENEHLKNCLEIERCNKLEKMSELHVENVESLEAQLCMEIKQRKMLESTLSHVTSKSTNQEAELKKWRESVRQLEKETEKHAVEFEEISAAHKKRYRDLELSYGRLKRESCDWQQKQADITISLDCFKASLSCLKNEQTQLLASTSAVIANMQDSLVSTRQKVCRSVTNALADILLKYKEEICLRKIYHNELMELRGNIRIFCRVRPTVAIDGGDCKKVVFVDHSDERLISVENDQKLHNFEMDRVFGPHVTQSDIFSELRPLLTSCVDGYNVSIFAYGQTGSGKTYTMEGPPDNPGINPRALQALFEETERKRPDWNFKISVSMLEIYNESVNDLFSSSNSKLDVKMMADGLFDVPGLVEIEISSIKEIYEILNFGCENRFTAPTKLNVASSRSHALLRVTVRGENPAAGLTTRARLNLIDLAGSERLQKSKASGERLKEAQAINKSLAAFGDVIEALKNHRPHVPYRNSKLTHLLQDSLSGGSKTIMVVQVAPNFYSLNETLCSLKFASRIRGLELGQSPKNCQSIGSTPISQNSNGFLPYDSTVHMENSQQHEAERAFATNGSKRTPNKLVLAIKSKRFQ